jgi:adenylyltransferase/sulfurtransferase
MTLSLDDLATRLSASGPVTRNPFLVRLDLLDPAYEITVFRDGRAIIKGTEDIPTARTLYARYIGT